MDKEKIKVFHHSMTRRKYLYDFRKKNHYTMFEVSEMIEMSRNYYEMIENGRKGQRLSLKTAYKLAILLSIELQDLYNLEEQYLEEQLHD